MARKKDLVGVFKEEKIMERLESENPTPIPFSQLTWGGNVRTAKTMRLDSMVHSLKRRGYMKNEPILVSRKGKNKFLVLCGNRRTKALRKIKETEPGTFKTILPDGKIPALILEGLTPSQEQQLSHQG